jgi:hypothetical protein
MSEAGGQENRGDHQTVLKRMLSAGPQGVMQAAGLFFTFAAVIAFVYAISSLIYRAGAKAALSPASQQFNVWQDLVLPNFSLIGLVVIGIVSALLALRLFSKATELISQVVRPAEAPFLWPLISGANREAINEYIRLASLTGFSGTFTKLGFTGLPLVTVALTLILLVMTLLVKDQTLSTGIFDLVKLTLGAFLGSFVQRNIEQEKLVGGRNLGGMGGGAPPTNQAVADKAAADKAGADKAAPEDPTQ